MHLNKNDGAESGPLAQIMERLFKARTILIHGEVNAVLAQSVTAQLLALSLESRKPINVFLHSPGGHVEAGDSIHDMIRFVVPEVRIVGTGWVASAGTHIFLAAQKQNRLCLPNTRFMIHQPLGGVGGTVSDVRIEAEEILKARERLNRTIAEATGQPLEQVAQDTDRNHWMSPQEAMNYGIVGRIIASADEL